MSFSEIVEIAGKVIDAAGVGVIVVGAVIATVLTAAHARGERARRGDWFLEFRSRLGRAILLGLELLVAADIIRTVAISPTLQSAGALAIIVLIRTFLSWSLEVEISGRWPWQKKADDRMEPADA